MAHAYTNLLTHIIFSTKNRAPLINDQIKRELHAYLGGMARELEGKAYIVNGVADHVHLLVGLPPTVSISDAVRTIKANSSRWVKEKWQVDFAWPHSYGAFSVSKSNVSDVIKYIQKQEEHHQKFDFKQEFVAFLKKHGIEYDERYLWEELCRSLRS